MINVRNTLLSKDRVHANLADFGRLIKPIPVFDKVIEVDVAPITLIVSTDSKIVFRNLFFFVFLFRFVVFISEVCNHFFNVCDMVM